MLSKTIIISYIYSNAFKVSFPGIKIISCYAHVTRNTTKQAAIVDGGGDYIENSILPVIKELSLAPNELAFDRMSGAALRKWKHSGQDAFAQYFEKVYLTEKWKKTGLWGVYQL